MEILDAVQAAVTQTALVGGGVALAVVGVIGLLELTKHKSEAFQLTMLSVIGLLVLFAGMLFNELQHLSK